MRAFFYILTAFCVIGLAFWAYRENYLTQAVRDETRQLQGNIGTAQARLSVLRAEWAYLNRPERLRELAVINFDRLGLMPLRADQFGRIDEVAFPPEPFLPITDPVDASAANAPEDGPEDGQVP